jgi:Uma2 family endonuclease
MPTAAAKAILDETDVQREDHFVSLSATWADYQRVLKLRANRSAPRITYTDGTLELMSPSFDHEAIKFLLGRLLQAYFEARDVEYTGVGAWTLESKRLKKSAEPDECYVLGPRKGKPKLPDLAIEVIWSSGGTDKLSIYAALGVREVWIWRRGKIVPHLLRGSAYKPATKSRVVPNIDLQLLAAHIDTSISTTAALKRYRAALGD